MRRVWIGMALCGALLVGGCGGGDDGDDGGSPERAETPAATTAPEETPDPAATPDPEPTTDPEATPAAGAEPIAEQTVKAIASRETTVDIAVLGLDVSGELATLRLEFGVQDPEAAPDDVFSLYDLNGGQPLYVSLLDPVNLRRYTVVRDSDGSPLQSDYIGTDVLLDSTTPAQYTFAAPPPDVTEIDVAVGDWPVFRDVPIAR
jgi:hypothetical protein